MQSQNITQQNRCLSWLEKQLPVSIRVTAYRIHVKEALSWHYKASSSKCFEDNLLRGTAAHLKNSRSINLIVQLLFHVLLRCLMRLRASMSPINKHSELRQLRNNIFVLILGQIFLCASAEQILVPVHGINQKGKTMLGCTQSVTNFK